MKGKCQFPEDRLAEMREAVGVEPRLVAVYVFGMYQPGDCDMAALFTEAPSWPERLDLELLVARSLELDGVQLVDLRRMPLAFRYWVLSHGEAIYTGQPDMLATFIEETIARYSAFYPLLEALYWKVETRPLAEDMLDKETWTMDTEP
jgi:hypothetical protein